MEHIKKRILITGNLGYIGPVLQDYLLTCNQFILKGIDNGYYENNIISNSEIKNINQIYKDVRNIEEEDLRDINTIVHLAAISNDPMGEEFKDATLDINLHASIRLANLAAKSGVSNFVFASSCSVYGDGGTEAKKEEDALNPLTSYAISKVEFENELNLLTKKSNMIATALRFSTACGVSPRLRVDLVLNDFVVSALTLKKIKILSDGSPLRPIIDVRDMSRAIHWAINRNSDKLNKFISVNVGREDNNMNIASIANVVKECLPETEIELNDDAQPDKRSYAVDFSYFKRIASDYFPVFSIKDSIQDLIIFLNNSQEDFIDFRSGQFIRLNQLKILKKNKVIDSNLKILNE